MVKSPILYTNVAVRNWEAWKYLGVGALQNLGSYFINSHLDYPVNFGGYNYPKDPEEPAIVHMVRFPHRSNAGLTPSEQKVAFVRNFLLSILHCKILAFGCFLMILVCIGAYSYIGYEGLYIIAGMACLSGYLIFP